MVLPSGEIVEIGNEKMIQVFPQNDTFTITGDDVFTESELLILEELTV